MIYKGMAVIIRNEDELECFAQAAEKKGYKFSMSKIRSVRVPVRISVNVRSGDDCLSKTHNLRYELNNGITEVVEASVLFRNQLIAMKHNARKASQI